MPSLNYYTLQKAIYEKIIGNSPLMALINGVFDHPPQAATFPYVTIGEIFISDFSNVNKGGVEARLIINIWSREAGHKQATDIMELIYGLLHNGTVTIAGKNLITMKCENTSIQLENDGWTYHGIMNLRVVLVDS